MNQSFPRMPSNPVKVACSFAVAGVLTVSSAFAAIFDSPYELTPPPPSGYFNAPATSTFGAWTLTTSAGDYRLVDTSMAPGSLQLSVIDFAGAGVIGADLQLQATALVADTFSFPFITAYGFNSPEIAFVQNGLDVLLNPASGFYTFTLGAGDTFGFRLHAIEGAIAGQATLTIVPEAGTAAWGLVLGFVAFGRRSRLRRS